MRRIPTYIAVSGILGIWGILCPFLVLADVTCDIQHAQLKQISYQRESGQVYIVHGISTMFNLNPTHLICTVAADGENCRNLYAMMMAAYLGGHGLSLRYADDTYNCLKPWGGLAMMATPVKYLYFNK